MKKSRFSEAQILGILRQQDQGLTVVQICREHSLSEATFYTKMSRPDIAIQVEGIIRPALYRPGW